MNLLSVEKISKSYGVRTLFDDVTFGLSVGEKVGVIGKNGAGKSTLLRILMEQEPPDTGRVVHNAGSRVEFLAQEPDLDPSLTALEALVADQDSEVFQVVRDYEHACRLLAQSPDDADAMEAVTKLSGRMDAVGGWTLDADAKATLGRVGIPDPDQPIATMSGGQKKRVALARALIRPSDLLVLDEPTNHLDIDTVEWLEGRLASRPGALLLITHDRYFLDRVVETILEVEDGTVYRHEGNYSYFLERRAEREELARKAEQKRKGLAKKELEWLRRGPKARTSKSKYRIEQAKALQESDYKGDGPEVGMDFLGTRLGKKVLAAEHVTKRFGDNTVVEDFTYRVSRDDRLGIVGPNGAGKTTLLNLLAGRLTPDEGEIAIGETVHLGYYDQEAQELDEEMRVLEYIQEVSNRIRTSEGEVSASQMLERFLFERPRQHALIKTLSGGERRRLYLLRTLMSEPNVIFLDEPTNDLDVETLSVLEDYLDGFDGALIVVSHDRYFLDRCVDHLLVIDTEGHVVEFPGAYTAWAEARDAAEAERRRAERARREAAEAKKAAEAPATPAKQRPKKLSYREQQEYERLEGRIAEIEARLEEIGEEMVAKATDYEAMQALEEERVALSEELEAGFERWSELAEIAEG